MPDIYNLHRAAFASAAAYVITKNGQRVATIAFKYPRDGAGRLYAYVHWLGTEMVRGFAAGGGYDKHSAACSAAARKLKDLRDDHIFKAALLHDNGRYWHDHLRDAGFDVLQAV